MTLSRPEIPITGSLPSKTWECLGKWVKMGEDVSFWKSKSTNGDKPPPERWQMVVFSDGVGILGDCLRKHRAKWGEMGGGNQADFGMHWEA